MKKQFIFIAILLANLILIGCVLNKADLNTKAKKDDLIAKQKMDSTITERRSGGHCNGDSVK